MSSPIGSFVKLYIDSRRRLEDGDVVQTPTGRSYRVLSVRVQQRGKHAGIRQHFEAIVIDPADVTDADSVLQIVWYRR